MTTTDSKPQNKQNKKKKKESIRILICSANLGNAMPDTKSMEAWVPSDGLCRFVLPPKGKKPEFPIVMDSRKAKNPPLPAAEVTEESAGAAAAGGDEEESTSITSPSSSNNYNKNNNNTNNNLTLSVSKSTSISEDSAEFQDFENMFAGQRESSAPSAAATGGEEELSSSLPPRVVNTTNDNDNDRFLGGGSVKESEQQRRDIHRMMSGLDMIDFESMGGAAFPEWDGNKQQQQPSNNNINNTPPESPMEEEEEPMKEMGMRDLSSSLSNAFPATPFGDFDAMDPPAPTSQSNNVDITYQSNSSMQSCDELEELAGGEVIIDESQFDIIVIGMQEATFNMEEEAEKLMEQEEEEGGDNNDDEAGGDETNDDDESESSSTSSDDEDDESRGGRSTDTDDEVMEGLLSAMDEDNTTAASTLSSSVDGDNNSGRDREALRKKSSSSKKSKVKAFSGALSKIGKAATKQVAKVADKVGKATVKNAKTAKTLVTERDNTEKPVPSPQQISNLEEDMATWSDTTVLHYMFEDQLPSYRRALSYQLGEMRLVIYYKSSNEMNLELLSVKTECTGKHGLANKGGIVAEVAVNETTRLGFLTAHLEAHEGAEHCANRCSSFNDILCGTRSSYTPFRYDASAASHFTFVMGDLNFRTKLYPGYGYGTEKHIRMCHSLANKKNWMALNRYDELAKCLRERKCLLGFSTPYCNFDPTFKVARQDGYQYNPKRSPSYTDRILFKAAEQLAPSLRPLIYEPIRAFTSSDHKPIRGAFDIRLNESLLLGPTLDPVAEESTGGRRSSVTPGQGRLHVLVSSMRCQIDKELYDAMRGSEREMPRAQIGFVSTPPEALLLDQPKTSPSKKKSSSSSSSSTKKFPETTIIPEAFKPNWKDEQLYFQLQTHHADGYPIDLAGALLHVSVLDKRFGEQKLWGAITLNLAKLIENARKPRDRVPCRSGSNTGNVAGRGGRGPQPMNGGGPMRPAPGRGAGGRPQGSGRGLQSQTSGRGGAPPPQGSGRGLQSPSSGRGGPPPPQGSGRGLQSQSSGRGGPPPPQGSGRGLQAQSSGRGGLPPPPGRGVPRTSSSGRQGPSGRGLQKQFSSGRNVQQGNAPGRGIQQHQSSSSGRVIGPGRGGPQGAGRGGPQGRNGGRGGRPAKRLSTDGRLQSPDGPGRASAPPPSPGRLKATIGARTRSRAAAQGRGPVANSQDNKPRRVARSTSPKRSRSPSPVPRARSRVAVGGWASSKPSKALQGAYQKEGMPEAVLKASKSLVKRKLAKEGAAPPPAKDIHILSLHLSEEPLLHGASQVGSITLSIDAWWMDDSDLPIQRQSLVV